MIFDIFQGLILQQLMSDWSSKPAQNMRSGKVKSMPDLNNSSPHPICNWLRFFAPVVDLQKIEALLQARASLTTLSDFTSLTLTPAAPLALK